MTIVHDKKCLARNAMLRSRVVRADCRAVQAVLIPTVRSKRLRLRRVAAIMRAVGAIESQLRTLVAARLGAREADIGEETSLTTDLGVDSLEMVSLIVEIEDEFEIDIPDEDAMHIATVKQLTDYVAFAAAAKELEAIPQIETRARRAC